MDLEPNTGGGIPPTFTMNITKITRITKLLHKHNEIFLEEELRKLKQQAKQKGRKLKDLPLQLERKAKEIAWKHAVTKVKEILGEPAFSDWKSAIKSKIMEINKTIYPKWIFPEMWKKKYKQIKDIGTVSWVFRTLFPKARMYIILYGNVSRNSKYFKKDQKLRMHINSEAGGGNEDRAGWLGYNRKTRKYEVHNIYNKYIHNLRFKIEGHIPEKNVWPIHF